MARQGRQADHQATGGGRVNSTPLITRICEAGPNLEVWRVNNTVVLEQDKNARVMPPEMMSRLVVPNRFQRFQ